MMRLNQSSRIASIVRAAAPLAVVAVIAGVLRRLPPAQNSFYPRCPLYEALHWKCAGCGATRAFAALLQGRFDEAIRLNGLATILLPVAAVYGLSWYWRFVQRGVGRWPPVPQGVVYAMLAATSIFTVLRNLPLRLFQ